MRLAYTTGDSQGAQSSLVVTNRHSVVEVSLASNWMRNSCCVLTDSASTKLTVGAISSTTNVDEAARSMGAPAAFAKKLYFPSAMTPSDVCGSHGFHC